MTTKSCPFCGESILEVAKKCKHCGEFLEPREPANQGAPQQAVVIEATGREWKAGKLLGWLIIFAAIPGCAVAGSGVGIPMLAIGIGVVIVANCGAWWGHG